MADRLVINDLKGKSTKMLRAHGNWEDARKLQVSATKTSDIQINPNPKIKITDEPLCQLR